jgi:hypothetical protein
MRTAELMRTTVCTYMRTTVCSAFVPTHAGIVQPFGFVRGCVVCFMMPDKPQKKERGRDHASPREAIHLARAGSGMRTQRADRLIDWIPRRPAERRQSCIQARTVRGATESRAAASATVSRWGALNLSFAGAGMWRYPLMLAVPRRPAVE